MQQELIEMLEKVTEHIVICNNYDQRFSSTSYGVKILEEAGELVEKAKNSAKEPAAPEVELRPEDFTVEVVVTPMGGFNPNVTHGVRVTHKPTGLSVSCDTERSQHKNRHIAFEQIKEMLTDPFKITPQLPAGPSQEPVTLTDEDIQSAITVWFEEAHADGATFKTRMRAAIFAALREKQGGV